MTRATVFLLLLFPALGHSQDQGRWDDVRRLRPGQKIQVVDAGLHKTKARLVKVTDQALIFKADGKEFTQLREDVRMVSVPQGSTGKRILMGILAGALLGISAWAHIDRCERSGCMESGGGWYEGSGKGLSGKSAFVVTGAAAGAVGILAIFAKDADKVIYSQTPSAPYSETSVSSGLDPDNSPILDSGNVFAPVRKISELPLARDSRDLLRALSGQQY